MTCRTLRKKHRTVSPHKRHDVRTAARRPSETGYALITTLWVMAVLGVMAASLAFEAQCESRIEAWSIKSRRAYNLARAGVHMTAGLIRQHARDTSHNLYDKWFSGPDEYENAKFGRGYYSIVRRASAPKPSESRRSGLFSREDRTPRFGLEDEESRLNINAIEFHQLCRLPGMTEPLAAGIIHYVTRKKKDLEEKNVERRKSGMPELEDEKGQVTMPVRRINELLEVEGMTENLLFGTLGNSGGLSDLLTCFSSGRVNINTASPEILRALGLDEQQVKVVMEYRRGKWDGFTSVDEALGLIGARAASLQRAFAVTSQNFRITCLAGFTPDNPEERITARLTLGREEMRFTLWESTTISGRNQTEALPRHAALN